MPQPSFKLISALRLTAERLETGARYEWGHMAHCNCGHLAQTVTNQSGSEISHAVRHTLDEWTEHARDLCPLTGNPVEELLDALHTVGFSRNDVKHLEHLSDRRVLRRMGKQVYLERNNREHLIQYLCVMADMLTDELPEQATCTPLEHRPALTPLPKISPINRSTQPSQGNPSLIPKRAQPLTTAT